MKTTFIESDFENISCNYLEMIGALTSVNPQSRVQLIHLEDTHTHTRTHTRICTHADRHTLNLMRKIQACIFRQKFSFISLKLSGSIMIQLTNMRHDITIRWYHVMYWYSSIDWAFPFPWYRFVIISCGCKIDNARLRLDYTVFFFFFFIKFDFISPIYSLERESLK